MLSSLSSTISTVLAIRPCPRSPAAYAKTPRPLGRGRVRACCCQRYVAIVTEPQMPPQKPSKHTPSREMAEAVAAQVLGFLAAEPERIARFLSLTGLTPQTLRQAAREPGFLSSVLDFLLNDEALAIAFAEQSGTEPETVAQARLVFADDPQD